jgi:hypothetical protein
MKDKVDVSRPLCIVAHEVIVALRSLLLVVAVQHALKTDAHTLDVVNWRPTGSVEEVETDDAV